MLHVRSWTKRERQRERGGKRREAGKEKSVRSYGSGAQKVFVFQSAYPVFRNIVCSHVQVTNRKSAVEASSAASLQVCKCVCVHRWLFVRLKCFSVCTHKKVYICTPFSLVWES